MAGDEAGGGMTIHRMARRLAALALRGFPTCDLQWALERRAGVEARMVGPYGWATLQVGDGPPIPVEGPCTITVNHD